MLELISFDLSEIATALADQESYEHRWLIDPRTGEIALWTAASCGTTTRSPVARKNWLTPAPVVTALGTFVITWSSPDAAQGARGGPPRR
jgi:hypothetical protein